MSIGAKTRYMGTFNDPNQLAFFLFMVMLLAYLYACQYGDRSFPAFYLLALPVILGVKINWNFAGRDAI